MINEFVKGIPKPQPRPRACARNGKAFIYNAETPAMRDWKYCIDEAMSRHGHKKLEGAFAVSLEFFMPRPRSHYRTGRFSHVLKDDAPMEHLVKGDVDNLTKTVLDQMTKSKYWKDDSQVVQLKVTKQWDDIFDAGCRIITEVL